jgi:hypothetical protein
LDQKPGSACLASSAVRRSAFPVRSKEVSEFGDAMLELGQTIGEVRHIAAPGW